MKDMPSFYDAELPERAPDYSAEVAADVKARYPWATHFCELAICADVENLGVSVTVIMFTSHNAFQINYLFLISCRNGCHGMHYFLDEGPPIAREVCGEILKAVKYRTRGVLRKLEDAPN